MMEFRVLTPNPALERTVRLPRWRPGGVHEVDDVELRAGGQGVHTARALWAWGAEATLYSSAAGAGGEYFRSELELEGISHVLLPVGGEIRTVVRIWESEPVPRVTQLHEPGPPLTVNEQKALVKSVCESLQEGDWLVMSGPLPPGVSPAFYLACLSEAKRRGCRVATDIPGAALAAVLKARAGAPDVVKTNAEQLAAASGLGSRAPREDFAWLRRPGAVREALQRLVQAGVAHPFVSLGAAGAVTWAQGTAIRARAPEVEVHDVRGCGDVFLAALLYALDAEGPVGAMRYATALGSTQATRLDLAPPAWEDAVRYASQVRLEAP